ncbi:hypothetical protein [Microlunatus sp. GCM10028923]|uniref:hypothetical protein n=1 Tax=Microlunatus sp. GCM10028923 TaxID=3273400 RepID=UPI0036232AE2
MERAARLSLGFLVASCGAVLLAVVMLLWAGFEMGSGLVGAGWLQLLLAAFVLGPLTPILAIPALIFAIRAQEPAKAVVAGLLLVGGLLYLGWLAYAAGFRESALAALAGPARGVNPLTQDRGRSRPLLPGTGIFAARSNNGAIG